MMSRISCAARLVILALVASISVAQADTGSSVQGVVRDSSGSVVAKAEVLLLNARLEQQRRTETDTQGNFSFENVPEGTYVLVVRQRGFAESQVAVQAGQESSRAIDVTLYVSAIHSEVTVTAVRGQVEDRLRVPQPVNTISQDKILLRAKSVTAQAVQEEPGLSLQRTSPTISGVFVRGLTGAKVNVFVDGIRFSTGAMRGGINTFLNLIDATNLDMVEVQRGPSGAQYGSDSIGGTVQLMTLPPRVDPSQQFHATFSTFFNSADAGFGSNLALTYGVNHFGISANVLGHRSSTLRTGDALDSHSALTRFLGISSKTLYDRNPGTAFTQYGGLFRMVWSPREGTNLSAGYLRNQQDGGRRSDQLLGGDGNLIADLKNLMNDFLYVRFDQAKAGFLGQTSVSYSYNVQREERVNQGGQGNPLAAITHEPERMRVHGINANAAKAWSGKFTTVFGLEYYHERIAAPSFQTDPVSGATSVRRGRVPDNALYRSGGIFAEGTYDVIPRRVRLAGAVRYSAASYRSNASDAPVVNGQPLWPDDSLRSADWTGRGALVLSPLEELSFVLNFSRGFRAPNITDLGTLGLTGAGFEVSAPEVAGRGATIGDSAGSAAVSTGRPVEQLEPEYSWTREAGVRYHNPKFETEFTYFFTDFYHSIEKFALILPPGAVGTQLGGQTITSQTAGGAVFVAAAANPVLVRVNQGTARFYGAEHDMEWRFFPGWAVRTVFTWVHASDRATGQPPNIEGGTPAPDFWLKLRYAPANRPLWIEPYLHAANRQTRLSSLDLADRRTGAERTRTSIQNFFRRGATVRGLISAGPDGILGNADDILIATGETLAQVQNRVLGVGVNSLPLFFKVPGYFVLGIRGGWRIGERHEIQWDFENIGDRNCRGISWGVDAPGRGISFRYTARF